MTVKFNKIVKETEKALQVDIDGKLIWLPKRGTEINGDEITSGLIEQKLAQVPARIERGNERIPLVIVEEREKSVKAEFWAAPMGDRTEEFKVTIFFGKRLIEDGTAPRWAVERSLAERLNPHHTHVISSGDEEVAIIQAC